jgi:hypothetical protein
MRKYIVIFIVICIIVYLLKLYDFLDEKKINNVTFEIVTILFGISSIVFSSAFALSNSIDLLKIKHIQSYDSLSDKLNRIENKLINWVMSVSILGLLIMLTFLNLEKIPIEIQAKNTIIIVFKCSVIFFIIFLIMLLLIQFKKILKFKKNLYKEIHSKQIKYDK